MSITRLRQLVFGGAAVAAAEGADATAGEAGPHGMPRDVRPAARPRFRIISDNDYSGDPDGLYQLVHHLLSPSVEIRAIIGSHLAPGDPWDPSAQQATNAHRKVLEVLRLMGLSGRVRAYQGSNAALVNARSPQRSAGAEAIVREAVRTDTPMPLVATFGAGLTELASAYLMEPRIADRLTAVWIGGPEYSDLAAPPPGSTGIEYNLRIDVAAAQVVFNDSRIPIWQVPRNVYRQCLVSMTELVNEVRPAGRLGAYLYDAIVEVIELAAGVGRKLGETYILGDSRSCC